MIDKVEYWLSLCDNNIISAKLLLKGKQNLDGGIFMLDKAEAREIAKNYSDKIKAILNPDRVILFGSYVNGNPHEWSDIDVAVLVSNLDDEAWYNARIKMQEIRWREDCFDDIEPHLLDENHDPSGFVEHVIKTGEVIYPNSHAPP
ncbi:MAG: nucleotidyltransferase domain-containing protein [Oscillospiraceae bacterium]|nr:nucleotidyltransferase domain-containing protein [Oscillospiraceae bacterium]